MKRVEILNFCQERMVKRIPKENGIYMTIRVGLIGIYKMINIWENNEWQIKVADASEVVARSEKPLTAEEINNWTNGMIEGLVEEKCDYVQVDNIPDVIQDKTSSVCSHNGFYGYSDSEGNETSEWYLPDGYQFVDENGNVINANKIVLEKKKKEYPKTYEECFNICFGNKHHIIQVVGLDGLGDNKELFESFIKLKICRDAYWKIAGEEMGLDKSWEPDWNDKKQDKHGFYNEIKDTIINSKVFVFPTAKMRDVFYENFKELIEECKELL